MRSIAENPGLITEINFAPAEIHYALLNSPHAYCLEFMSAQQALITINRYDVCCREPLSEAIPIRSHFHVGSHSASFFFRKTNYR